MLKAVFRKWPVAVLVQPEEVQRAVAVPGRAGKYGRVGLRTHLVRVNARFVGAGGMVLVRRLHVHGRLRGCQRIILADERKTVRAKMMPGLDGVEVEPVRLVKP